MGAKGILRIKLLGDASDLDKTLTSTGSRLDAFAGKAKVAAAAVGAAFAAAAGAVIKTGIQYNSSIEQTTISLGTMLGSQEKATKLIREMTEFAARTPFEFEGLAEATKQLVAYGFGAEDIIPTMTRLGDVSAALGIPINDIAYLYGTARVQGRLFMQDINQMTNRGIPIIGELAKQFGVSEAEVRKLVEAGKVGFPEVEKAFKALTDEGGKFGGLMEAQSKSFAGQWSTIKDTVAQIAGQITLPLFTWLAEEALPAVNRGLEWFMDKLSGTNLSLGMFGDALNLVNPIMGLFKEFWPTIQPLLAMVGDLLMDLAQQILPLFSEAWRLIVDIVGPIVREFLGLVAEVFPEILDLIKSVMEALLPIVRDVLEQIRAFWDEHGEKIMAVVRIAFEWIRNNIESVLNVISGIIKVVTALISGDWEKAWEGIKQIFSGVWGTIKGLASAAIEAVKNVISAGLNAIKGVWERIWGAVKSFFESIWNGIKSFAETIWNSIKSAASTTWNGIKDTLSGIWEGIKGAFGKLWEGMKDLWQRAWEWIKSIPGKVKDLFADAGQWLYEAGKAVLQGFWDGIKSMAGAVWDGIKGIGSSIKDGFKGLFGIGSPSKVFTDYGASLMQGLVRGITGALPAVERAMGRVPDITAGLNMTGLQSAAAAPGYGSRTMQPGPAHPINVVVNIYEQQGAEAGEAAYRRLLFRLGAAGVTL